MTKKIVVLLGLPGAGKGTQGTVLANELKIPHISTGDIFRKVALKESDEAKLINSYINQGKLVPSELVNKIVIKYIVSEECASGCILDGYPRTLRQAEYFIEHADSNVIVLFFDLSDDQVIKRILGRYNCSSCGKVYNKYSYTPKKQGICDVCGASSFVSREDDDEETIAHRIELYKEETLPLVQYYKNKGSFFLIDAGRSRSKVTKEVLRIAKMI
jgi:adenylate kinase